ncbi:MAG: hypothetical protein L0207_06805 [Chlamydiae bacterium]|nr:hypothetical protein [Chlamydiota bacterium]
MINSIGIDPSFDSYNNAAEEISFNQPIKPFEPIKLDFSHLNSEDITQAIALHEEIDTLLQFLELLINEPGSIAVNNIINFWNTNDRQTLNGNIEYIRMIHTRINSVPREITSPNKAKRTKKKNTSSQQTVKNFYFNKIANQVAPMLKERVLKFLDLIKDFKDLQTDLQKETENSIILELIADFHADLQLVQTSN